MRSTPKGYYSSEKDKNLADYLEDLKIMCIFAPSY